MSRIRAYDDPGTAGGYGKRPGTTRSERRVLGRLLAACGPVGRLLDVPCGRGRLSPVLGGAVARSLVGADGSRAMLEGAGGAYDHRVLADAARLPFASASFDVVVCMRLLHHFADGGERRRILGELARVSRGRVVFSYYDSGTLEGLRRRWRRKRPSPRLGLPRGAVVADLRSAGLRMRRRASLFPFVREQTLVLADRAG